MDNAKIEELKREITSMFALIQKLDAPMTENNVVIMNACLGSMRFLINSFDEALKGVDTNGDADAE